jgi:rod shape-determining protein MreD
MPTLHLRRKSALIALLIATLYTLVIPTWWLPWRFNAFLSVLVIATYTLTPIYTLWMATVSGFILDLLAGPYPMGLHAISFSITTTVLIRLKNYFFDDSLSTLPLLVALASMLSTCVLILGLAVSNQLPPLSSELILFDCIIMACYDAILATILFVIPAWWWQYQKQKRLLSSY